jgi:hypothetical protein
LPTLVSVVDVVPVEFNVKVPASVKAIEIPKFPAEAVKPAGDDMFPVVVIPPLAALLAVSVIAVVAE